MVVCHHNWCGTNDNAAETHSSGGVVALLGSQSQAGEYVCGTAATVVTTLRAQNRHVLVYDCCLSCAEGKPAPSLLPEAANSSDQILPACLTPER